MKVHQNCDADIDTWVKTLQSGRSDYSRPGRGRPIDSLAAMLIESHLASSRMFASLARNYLSTGHFQLASENLSNAKNAFLDAQQALQSIGGGAGPEWRSSLEAAMAKLATTLSELSTRLEPGSAGDSN